MTIAPAAAQSAAKQPGPGKKGTILLVSSELDKAILAFEIAAGFQAMGMEISMWFVLYGANCLRKPRSIFSPAKWFGRLGGGAGRRPETDIALQRVVCGLNHDGASKLPLSQLNYGGVGPLILRHIMRRKGMAQLEDLIRNAAEIGVRFTICQVCVNAMAVSVPDDLIVRRRGQGCQLLLHGSRGGGLQRNLLRRDDRHDCSASSHAELGHEELSPAAGPRRATRRRTGSRQRSGTGGGISLSGGAGRNAGDADGRHGWGHLYLPRRQRRPC